MIVIMFMMMVVMVMVVTIVMMLTMFVVMIMDVEMIVLGFVLDESGELFTGRRLIGHLRFRHDEIDDLLFKKRSTDLDKRLWLLAIIFKHLALLAGELTGAADEPVAQFLVGDRFLRALDRLHRHIERGGFPGERCDAVALWKCYVDRPFVTGRGAHQLVLETGNELAGADFQRNILCGTAVERLAIELADEG